MKYSKTLFMVVEVAKLTYNSNPLNLLKHAIAIFYSQTTLTSHPPFS